MPANGSGSEERGKTTMDRYMATTLGLLVLLFTACGDDDDGSGDGDADTGANIDTGVGDSGPTMPEPIESLEDLVDSNATLEMIATGFENTEGPVWHPDGYLLFSDIQGNTIHKWTPDGDVETFRSPSGNSNGLALDGQNRLIACEHGNRRVSRTESDGTVTALADEYEGKRLNSPNDAVVKSDGSIYFTDPPYGISEDEQELEFQGVYRVLPDGETLELLVEDMYQPNGLAFSPDETVLYIAECLEPSSGLGSIYAFDVQPDDTLANRRLFIEPTCWPDGIKVDTNGNLYIATNIPNVKIYNRLGEYVGEIETPEITRNCAFGGSDHKTLFITAMTSVYRIQMNVSGK
jgi:sugar lactone lactonase YvrE